MITLLFVAALVWNGQFPPSALWTIAWCEMLAEGIVGLVNLEMFLQRGEREGDDG